MTHILHIACDFPDDINSNKTPAVLNLVNSSRELHHTIFSLNRAVSFSTADFIDNGNGVFATTYFGFPYGIGLRFFLARAARRILQKIRSECISPDIIHCHKLTFEGVIGYYLSRELDLPMICSIRGDTDFKLIRFKPAYRSLYRNILHHSRGALFIAPWSKFKLESMWPADVPSLSAVLPNIVELPTGAASAATHSSYQLATVFHLKDYRRKNVFRLIDAVDTCIEQGIDTSLDIIGGGDDVARQILQRYIDKTRHPQKFRLLGHRSHDQLVACLGQYVALVLPSFPETFGMVYLEALYAGIPFLHSRNAGVDGYFAGKNVSISVDHNSRESIRDGIATLIAQQAQFRESVHALMTSSFMDQFKTVNICNAYMQFLQRALAR
jgi:glycosyltransferase involved in cell wall biosynthesis